MPPFFSVIIPLYNKEKHIKNTIQSVLNQSFTRFEVIIVNDGSTDQSEAIVSTFEDDRIHLISTQNKGVSHARNLGTRNANSEHLVFLDADDTWHKNHLEDLNFLFQTYPDCGMYCMAYEKDFGHSIQLSHFNHFPKGWHGVLKDYFKASMRTSIASSSSVMIKNSVFKSLKGFNESYNSGEDTDLWIRVALKHTIAFYSMPTVRINMLAANKASLLSKNQVNYLDLNHFKSAYKSHPSLSTYINLNRFSLAIQHKLNGEKLLFQQELDELDLNQLNMLQTILLKSPRTLLKFLLSLKEKGKQLNLHLSFFK